MAGEQKTRYAPSPLSTLEMQKKGTGILRTSGDNIMGAAESLYQKGLISYPRTETDVFDPAENLPVRVHSALFLRFEVHGAVSTMQPVASAAHGW